MSPKPHLTLNAFRRVAVARVVSSCLTRSPRRLLSFVAAPTPLRSSARPRQSLLLAHPRALPVQTPATTGPSDFFFSPIHPIYCALSVPLHLTCPSTADRRQSLERCRLPPRGPTTMTLLIESVAGLLPIVTTTRTLLSIEMTRKLSLIPRSPG
jgi:hypothetical protein